MIYALMIASFLVILGITTYWPQYQSEKVRRLKALESEPRLCQLCRSFDVWGLPNEQKAEYRCQTCGFRSEMRLSEGLGDYFGALNALDEALSAFDWAAQITALYSRAPYLPRKPRQIFEETPRDAWTAYMEGLEGLNYLLNNFPRPCSSPMPHDEGDIQSHGYGYIGDAARQGEWPGRHATGEKINTLDLHIRAGIDLMVRARAALVQAIRQQLGEEAFKGTPAA